MPGGYRLREQEAATLMKVTGREIFEIMAAADRLREKKAGDIVMYVRNQNLHITTI